MQITGTHINYFFVCKRKLWLFANGLQMEHTSDLVQEGALIHETTFTQRSDKFTEIEIGSIKIDFYDPKAKVIHEVKKTATIEIAHEWQLKYYIFILQKAGIEGVTGVLEYPKLRQIKNVYLSLPDLSLIEQTLKEIPEIVNSEFCPSVISSNICKNCSYFDFCYVTESNIDPNNDKDEPFDTTN